MLRNRRRTGPTPPDVATPSRPRIDFGYGRSDVSQFPRAAWLRSLRTVLTEAPSERFGYLSGHGMPELREALAGYLNRVRGTAARPENVVICNGYAQGSRAADAGAGRGRGAAGWRSRTRPSATTPVPVARALGMSVVGVPVDEDGVRVDELARSGADAVVLTPSHQWPTGGVLARRGAGAVCSAGPPRTGALVIEDDYDAEYRYDRSPIGAMQGLAPDLVAYAGSASKTLAPGLRLGWLVVPARLSAPVAEAKIARRPRLAGDRPAGVRGLPHPRRVRPAPAPHAPGVPAPPRRAAGGAGGGGCRTSWPTG